MSKKKSRKPLTRAEQQARDARRPARTSGRAGRKLSAQQAQSERRAKYGPAGRRAPVQRYFVCPVCAGPHPRAECPDYLTQPHDLDVT